MYTFIALFIFSLSSFASDYLCRTPLLSIELFYNSQDAEILITDLQSHETIYFGSADYIRRDNNLTDFIFPTSSNQDLQITFKTVSLESGGDKIFGFINGYAGRGFLNQSLKCFKK
jgi:hypothetical protein